jgi:hypothetical protein
LRKPRATASIGKANLIVRLPFVDDLVKTKKRGADNAILLLVAPEETASLGFNHCEFDSPQLAGG